MGVEVQTISPGDGKFMRLCGFRCGGGGIVAGEFPGMPLKIKQIYAKD